MDERQRARQVDEIRQAMDDRNMSQAALARESGVDKDAIGRMLRGGNASATTLRKVRDHLGLRPESQSVGEPSDPEGNVDFAMRALRRWLLAAPPEYRVEYLSALFACIAEASIEIGRNHPNG